MEDQASLWKANGLDRDNYKLHPFNAAVCTSGVSMGHIPCYAGGGKVESLAKQLLGLHSQMHTCC